MVAYKNYKKGDYTAALDYLNKSEAYPGNLGSGAPSYPDYRNQNFLRVKIYNKTGEDKKANDAKIFINESTEKFGEQKGGNIFEQSFADIYV